MTTPEIALHQLAAFVEREAELGDDATEQQILMHAAKILRERADVAAEIERTERARRRRRRGH